MKHDSFIWATSKCMKTLLKALQSSKSLKNYKYLSATPNTATTTSWNLATAVRALYKYFYRELGRRRPHRFCGNPLGWKQMLDSHKGWKNAEMKLHFTTMLLLLQWQKESVSDFFRVPFPWQCLIIPQLRYSGNLSNTYALNVDWHL